MRPGFGLCKPACRTVLRGAPALKPVVWWGAWRTLGSAVAWGSRAWAVFRPGAPGRLLHERLALASTLREIAAGGPWWHAASVGEVRALIPMSRALNWNPAALITTNTATGRAIAEANWPARVRLAPLDAAGPVDRFLSAVDPPWHLTIETELWPVRFARLCERGASIVIVSGRLSVARWKQYQKLQRIYAQLLSQVQLVCPATPEDGERFVALGLPADRLGPVGSLKWEAASAALAAHEIDQLADQLGLDRTRPWLALGSVHPGEALVLLDALAAGGALPCGVLLAPRHHERFARELAAIRARGWRVHAISQGAAPADTQILVLDRIGILPKIYSLTRVAVLGGSFVPVGGHTPLEAAVAGCPIVAGPFTEKQAELCAPLRAAGALFDTADPHDAAARIRTLLADPSPGVAGIEVVARHRGVAIQLAAAVRSVVPGP